MLRKGMPNNEAKRLCLRLQAEALCVCVVWMLDVLQHYPYIG